MIKTQIIVIASGFMLSCGSNGIVAETDETETPTQNYKAGKYGDWEQDDQGNKFREDYALKKMLSGYQLVKFTRTDGGQYGGGSSTTKFTLCSDGSMQYYHQSLTTVSVDGAGGSNASEDDDYGTWKALETHDGYKLLMIKSTKYNNVGYMELKLVGSSKIQMVWFKEWQEFLLKKMDC